MDVQPPDHENRIRQLEHQVSSLECQLQILREHMDAGFRTLAAELRAETARVIGHRDRWMLGLLITILIGIAGILSRLL